MIKYLLYLFSLLSISTAYSQQTFTFSGIVRNAKTHKPVDNSILIKVFAKTGQPYQTYTDDGKYSFALPDSLAGTELRISFEQDENRIKKEHLDGPCATDCTTGDFYFPSNEKLTIQLDSTRSDAFDTDLAVSFRCSSYASFIYFKKNEIQPIKLEKSEYTGYDICEVFSGLVCDKKAVIEISAHSSPDEKDKQNLSLKRGQFLKDTLVKLGINPARLIIKAYGDTRPAELKDVNGLVVGLAAYEERRRVVFSVIISDFKE